MNSPRWRGVDRLPATAQTIRIRVFLLLAIVLTVGGSAHAADLRIGRAAVVITPPTGMPMGGYYRARLSEGVHDDLQAKALVLESGGTKVALVACDLVNLPREFVEKARVLAAEATGIPGSHIMISATHAHTSPEMGSRLRGASEEAMAVARDYHARLPQLIAESIRKADQGLTPAEVSAGTVEEHEVSFIRRFWMEDGTVGWNPGKKNPGIVRPVGSIDPEVSVVYFQSPNGTPQATYVNFANHLDTVGGEKFSADYPYELSRILGAVKGPEMLTLFTIGAAGQINHVDVSSAEPQKGHGEAARIGAVLAADVIKAYRIRSPVGAGSLAAAARMVQLPARRIEPGEAEWARRVVEQYGPRDSAPFLDLVRAFRIIDIEERGGKPYEAEVQVIALGRDVAWVALPGEIFVEHGKRIKAASPFRFTIVVELANGSLGYVPDRKAYPQGAYEAVSTRLAPGGGEKMAETAIELLIDLHNNASNR